MKNKTNHSPQKRLKSKSIPRAIPQQKIIAQGITPLTISSGSKPASKVTSCGNQKNSAKANSDRNNFLDDSDIRYVSKPNELKSRLRGRSQSKGKRLGASHVENKSPIQNVIKNRSPNKRHQKSPSPVKGRK